MGFETSGALAEFENLDFELDPDPAFTHRAAAGGRGDSSHAEFPSIEAWEYERFRSTRGSGDPDQTLFIYTTEPATSSRQALELLVSWIQPAATTHT
jgi:hypothetical protein